MKNKNGLRLFSIFLMTAFPLAMTASARAQTNDDGPVPVMASGAAGIVAGVNTYRQDGKLGSAQGRLPVAQSELERAEKTIQDAGADIAKYKPDVVPNPTDKEVNEAAKIVRQRASDVQNQEMWNKKVALDAEVREATLQYQHAITSQKEGDYDRLRRRLADLRLQQGRLNAQFPQGFVTEEMARNARQVIEQRSLAMLNQANQKVKAAEAELSHADWTTKSLTEEIAKLNKGVRKHKIARNIGGTVTLAAVGVLATEVGTGNTLFSGASDNQTKSLVSIGSSDPAALHRKDAMADSTSHSANQ